MKTIATMLICIALVNVPSANAVIIVQTLESGVVSAHEEFSLGRFESTSLLDYQDVTLTVTQNPVDGFWYQFTDFDPPGGSVVATSTLDGGYAFGSKSGSISSEFTYDSALGPILTGGSTNLLDYSETIDARPDIRADLGVAVVEYEAQCVNCEGFTLEEPTYNYTVTTTVDAIDPSFIKTQQFIDFHTERAESVGALANVMELTSCAIDFQSCVLTESLESILSDAAFVVVPALVVGTVAAILSGNLLLMTGAALAVTGSFASYMAMTHEQLAADPPDENYQVVEAYSGADFSSLDMGFGDAFNAQLRATYNALFLSAESVRGALISLERYQGALAAGDGTAAVAQLVAYEKFASNVILHQDTASQELLKLPSAFRSLGVTDFVVDPSGQTFFGAFEDLADSLERPQATAVSEPAPLGMFCAALLWIAYRTARGRREVLARLNCDIP